MNAPRVVVPVKVTWPTMMAGKLTNAMRPRRLAAFLVAAAMLGVGLALVNGGEVTASVSWALGVVIVLRLVVMAVASLLDTSASSRFDGLLEFSAKGVVHTGTNGDAKEHPWAWVLEAVERRGVFVLRVDERGGRLNIFLRHESLKKLGTLEALRDLLGCFAKLRR